MWAIEHGLEPCILSFISNVCLKYAPKCMISRLIFQKFSGEGLTEPPPQTPPPVFSRASPSVRASPSILGRFAPSTRASPSILGRFAPSIRASPSTFDWGSWFGPQSKFLDPPVSDKYDNLFEIFKVRTIYHSESMILFNDGFIISHV